MIRLFKKKTATAEKKRYTSTLTINYGNMTKRWTCSEEKDFGMIEPFKSFYKWFFGREDSDYFAMKWNGGQETLLRKKIDSFKVEKKIVFI